MPPEQRRASPGRSSRPTNNPNVKAGEQAAEAVFLILVVVALLGSFLTFLQGGLLQDKFSELLGRTRFAIVDTYADIFDSPAGTRIGSQVSGSRGDVREGPSRASGDTYWLIDFERGTDGWAKEPEVRIVIQEGPIGRILNRIVSIFKILSTIVSLIFLSGIVYSVIRHSQVTGEARKKEIEKEDSISPAVAYQEHVNRRWEKVIAHVQSESPADWRLAVLEADIMLAELLERMGYAGENVGEKLKTVEQSDFNTIEEAWEAHKIRNLIAHQGSDYVLSRREAQRVIGLYSNVFREFRYI